MGREGLVQRVQVSASQWALQREKEPCPLCSIGIVYVDFCVVNSPTRADLNLPSM